MACTCCQGIVGGTLAQMSRLGHLFVVITTFLAAILIADNYYPNISRYSGILKLELGSDCPNNDGSCIYKQLLYRASLSLILLFSSLGFLSLCTSYVDHGMWLLKFMIAWGVFIGFLWVEDSIFTGWAELSRILSFFWLLIQAILLLDFAHDIHDIIIDKADTAEQNGGGKFWYGIYIFLSLGSLTCVATGLTYLFLDYVECKTGMTLVIITLLTGLLTTVVSLLDGVNKGLLTPSIMFAYSTFICWYALLSSIDNTCNPHVNDNQYMTSSKIIILVISLLILMYCVLYGTTILNIFNPEAPGVMSDMYGSSGGGGGGGRNNNNENHLDDGMVMDRTPLSPTAARQTHNTY
eukprot:gene7797-15954_t